MSESSWKLSGGQAFFTSPKWQASVSLDGPSMDLTIRCVEFRLDPLFSFLLADAPSDYFTRGDALILQYPPRNSDLVSYQVQVRPNGTDQRLDLIVSAQTELLESAPTTKLRTTCAPARFLPVQEGGYLLRPANSLQSVLVMVHPADYYRSQVDGAAVSEDPDREAFTSEDISNVTFWVFPDSLEKGVIRRARFSMQFLARENDDDVAKNRFEEAMNEPPPLSTY